MSVRNLTNTTLPPPSHARYIDKMLLENSPKAFPHPHPHARGGDALGGWFGWEIISYPVGGILILAQISLRLPVQLPHEICPLPGRRSGGALTGCVPGVSRSDHIRSIRSGPRRPEGCESCTGRAAAPFPLGAETSRAGRVEGCVFPGTAGTCRVRVRNPGALRGRLGAGVVAYVPPPGRHGNRLCFRCIVATRRFPGGMRRPHILRSVEELRVIWRVYRPVGCFGMRRYASVWFTCEVRVLARNVTVRHA